PHMKREHVMMLTGEDLVTSLSDKLVLLVAQPLTGMICRRGAFLQNGVGVDHFTGNQVLADAEMFQRTLSLSAPELVRRYFNYAEAVRFLPHVLHVHFSSSFFHSNSTSGIAKLFSTSAKCSGRCPSLC